MSRTFKIVCAHIAVLALLGCAALSWLGWGGSVPEEWASTSAPLSSEEVVQVAMSWDEPVDVDLQLWDAERGGFVMAATDVTYDITDGDLDDEYIDFRRYPRCDLSSGTYVVSVRFVDGAHSVESTKVTLYVTKADGTVEERTHDLLWEEGKNQWHAFSIDAETGEIEDIDEVVDTRLRVADSGSRRPDASPRAGLRASKS